jgi:cation:H+ antiporter
MPDSPDDFHGTYQGSSKTLLGRFFSSLSLFAVSLICCAVFWWLKSGDALWAEVGFVLAAAAAIAIVISEACDPFADAAQWVGVKMRLPSSVRGATLDAIASSMPELFTGLFFVTVALTGTKDQLARMAQSAEGYGSTIATCAGSSIYNLVLIPAVCALAVSLRRPNKPYVGIERDVVNRDGMWVIIVQFGLLYFLFQPELHWWMGVVALVAYVVYVSHLFMSTRAFRRRLDSGEEEVDDPDEEASVLFGFFEVGLNRFSASVILITSTIVAALACYFLVELTNSSAVRLGVSPFFVAVILTAAVSSIPDTFMSLGSSMRGDDSGAVSNVFGSNIFDICIGMSIPLLVCCYLNNWQPVSLIGENGETMSGVVGLRVLLFFLSVFALSCMWYFRRIGRVTAVFFCLLYLVFVGYAIVGGMIERGLLNWGQI